jgi:hypothetical protein
MFRTHHQRVFHVPARVIVAVKPNDLVARFFDIVGDLEQREVFLPDHVGIQQLVFDEPPPRLLVISAWPIYKH